MLDFIEFMFIITLACFGGLACSEAVNSVMASAWSLWYAGAIVYLTMLVMSTKEAMDRKSSAARASLIATLVPGVLVFAVRII